VTSQQRELAGGAPTGTVERMPGPSQGSVVLDIGGDVGAAVVLTTAALESAEIEIRPRGCDWNGTHVAVRSRPTGGNPVYAAVFGHLRKGRYELRLRPPAPDGKTQEIEVTGGRLTECRWNG
jgi:hypothetical protein